MTVWIVEEHFEWEGSQIVAVFSEQDKAVEEADRKTGIETCDMRTFTAKAYVVDDLTRHDD